MENRLSYEIDLQTLGLQNITKIVNLLETITQKIDIFSSHAEKDFNKAGSEAGNVIKGLQNIGTEAEKTKNKLSLGDRLKGWSDGLLSLKTVASTVAGSIGSIFQEGMARETAAVNFGTLLGDANAGKKYADQLRGTDAAALYGTATVNEAAKSMISFGISSDTAINTVKQLGDIAGGDAQKLGSLSLAFAQISASGKLSGQDLMQLVNAGFNPLEEISKKTGKSIGQLKDEMAKGAISSQDVAEAIASATGEGGKFNGMLQNIMNNTLQGKMAVMQGKFDDIKAKLFELALPIVDKLIPVITKLTDTLIPLAENVVAPLLTFIADNFDTILYLAECIGAVVLAIKIWTGAQWLLNIALNANPIGAIIMAIVALIAVVTAVTTQYHKWGAAVTFLLGPLGMIINIVMTIKRYWNDIVQAFQGDGIIAGLKRIGVMLLDMLLYPVQQLLELLSHIPGLGDLANTGAMVIKGLRMKMGAINPETETPETKEDTDTNSTMEDLTTKVNAGTGGNGGIGDGSSAAKGIEKVASGGTRNTQITITLGNLVENVNFNGGVEENRENTLSTFKELLLRVLTTAETAV